MMFEAPITIVSELPEALYRSMQLLIEAHPGMSQDHLVAAAIAAFLKGAAQ
jgi:hypothetical protein